MNNVDGSSPAAAASEPIVVVSLMIAAAMVTTQLTWLAGALARWISGAGWPSGTSNHSASLVIALASTGDASYSWRKATRTEPGPDWLFWPLLMMAVLAVSAVVFGVMVWWRNRKRERSATALGAQWGLLSDERKIAVPDHACDRPGRLVAGRGIRSQKLLASDDCISAVAFGPNGSGKTMGLVIPNAMEWDGPCVVSTTKGPDLESIIAARRRVGPVYIIAPSGLMNRTTNCWSPVAYATDQEAADRMARWQVGASGMGDDQRSKPWAQEARSLVGPLLLAACASGGGIDRFYRWVREGQDAAHDVRSILVEHGFEQAAEDYTSVWRLHPDGVGSVEFTARSLVDAYSNPRVRASAAKSDFTAEQVLDENATVCIVAPPSEADAFAPLFTSMNASIVHAAEKRFERTGRPVAPRLGLFFDEAGNVFRYPGLTTLLTTARGMGIQLLTIWHDLAQLQTLYGNDAARTIVSNSKLRLLLKGVGDLSTLQYFSQMLGSSIVSRGNLTIGTDGRNTFGSNPTREELAPLHELQQLADWRAVLQYDNLPPMRVELRKAFCEPALVALTTEPGPMHESSDPSPGAAVSDKDPAAPGETHVPPEPEDDATDLTGHMLRRKRE